MDMRAGNVNKYNTCKGSDMVLCTHSENMYTYTISNFGQKATIQIVLVTHLLLQVAGDPAVNGNFDDFISLI